MTFDLPDRCLQTSKPTSNALGIPIYAEHGELRLRLQARLRVLFDLSQLEYLFFRQQTQA